MRFISLLSFSVLLSLPLTGQGELTVEDIQHQSAFIDAKQLALLGKTEAAIASFENLAKQQVATQAVQFELARLYRASGNPSQAIDHMRKAYSAQPNEVYANYLANLYRETGQHTEEAELYQDLIRQHPGVEHYYLQRAAALVRARQPDRAIAVYDELERRIGVNSGLARLKHALYLESGDLKRAEKELTALIEAQPKQLGHRHLLAGFHLAQGNEKAARKVYQEILAIEPADVRAQLALQDAGAPVRSGLAGDGDQLLALLGRPDVDIDLKIGKLLPLVQAVTLKQNPEKAARNVELAQELWRAHPDEAKAAALLGDTYLQAGRLGDAAKAYITTLELDENVYAVWDQLLSILYLTNQSVKLRKYAAEALDLYPNRPGVYLHYALGEALRADFGEAASLLGEASLMLGSQPEVAQSFAEVRDAINALRTDGDVTGIDLTLIPGGPDGPLGFLLVGGEDLATLKRYDSPSNTNALFLEKLGTALKAAGEAASATEAFQRAKAAGSKSRTLPLKLSGD